jgi:hypothetical protein
VQIQSSHNETGCRLGYGAGGSLGERWIANSSSKDDAFAFAAAAAGGFIPVSGRKNPHCNIAVQQYGYKFQRGDERVSSSSSKLPSLVAASETMCNITGQQYRGIKDEPSKG